MTQKPRDITIHAVMNGYLVQVGCQQVVFESTSKLMEELMAYLKDPQAVEKRYGWDPTKEADGPTPATPPGYSYDLRSAQATLGREYVGTPPSNGPTSAPINW